MKNYKTIDQQIKEARDRLDDLIDERDYEQARSDFPEIKKYFENKYFKSSDSNPEYVYYSKINIVDKRVNAEGILIRIDPDSSNQFIDINIRNYVYTPVVRNNWWQEISKKEFDVQLKKVKSILGIK